MTISQTSQPAFSLKTCLALCASPAIVIFVSSNFVNLGNLAFNMLFSRWMGPELFGDLAIVLTVKLAILAVLGALQMAVSLFVASAESGQGRHLNAALSQVHRTCFIALWLALPVLAVIISAGSLGTRLGLSSPYLLFILLGSLPFCAPLNILRGMALGQMNSGKIVISANVEMAVRLGLGTMLWYAGLGIEGVVAAIAISIIAGWAVLADLLPKVWSYTGTTKPVAKTIGLFALPFALLQVAQVISIDGDIILATRFLTDTETGYVAALTLFQRIQFFACFALSGILLPSVVVAVRKGVSYTASITSIAALLIAVSGTVIGLTLAFPEQLISLLVGADYLAASPYLIASAIAAALFTANYLIATFLMALESRHGIFIVVFGAAVQLGLMIATQVASDGDLSAMLNAKLTAQALILACLAMRVWTLKLSS